MKRFELKPIEIIHTSLSMTAANAKRVLNLPSKEHLLRRIYTDGTCYEMTVPHEKIYDAIAYNVTFRNEAAIMVDNNIVYQGNIENDALLGIVEKIIKTSSYNKIHSLFAAS